MRVQGQSPAIARVRIRDGLRFLNRHGGALLLGVTDKDAVTGIDPNALDRIRKDFVAAINNPQKLTPPTYLSINTAELDGKTLLHIYVPESSQVHRCNARIYDRNEDADLDITDLTVEVVRLYQRKQAPTARIGFILLFGPTVCARI